MQKSQKVLIAGGVGVVVLAAVVAFAGPVVYRDLIAAPPAEAPTLSGDAEMIERGDAGELDSELGGAYGDEATGEALEPASLLGEWTVSDGSEAGYRVDEVLNGTDITVTGRTAEVSGSFTIGGDGLTLESAELAVDVASITTDSSSRDRYFREQALRVDQHPTATFVLSDPVSLGSPPAAGEVFETEATGVLTLAGVSQNVSFTVQVMGDGDTAAIAGAIPVVFADFEVEAPNLGFVSVEPEGFVEFKLAAAKA